MSAKIISAGSMTCLSAESTIKSPVQNGFGAWIGVDFDGTLAQYTHGTDLNEIGDPIEPMIARVRKWLAQGRTVKIFTARAAIPKQVEEIKFWLVKNGLPALEVTNVKDFGMIELWDDRCVQVNANTGVPVFETAQLGDRMQVKVKISRQRGRNGSKPVSKLLLAIGRFASTWNQVPSHEFQPAANRPR